MLFLLNRVMSDMCPIVEDTLEGPGGVMFLDFGSALSGPGSSRARDRAVRRRCVQRWSHQKGMYANFRFGGFFRKIISHRVMVMTIPHVKTSVSLLRKWLIFATLQSWLLWKRANHQAAVDIQRWNLVKPISRAQCGACKMPIKENEKEQ